MEIALFAKKRTTKDGKPYVRYLSTLTRKDGTTQPVEVCFRAGTYPPKAESCPCMIEFNPQNANIAPRAYTDTNTGEAKTAYRLWLNDFAYAGEYIDHSFDEFVTE